MKQVHDQTGKIILLPAPPRRIISVVPSQTELLSYFGLDEAVVGITKFCVHPTAWFAAKTKVGGTKQLKVDLIKSLLPDLVIANKEENIKEQIEAIQQFCPVWTSDVTNLETAFNMIEGIGFITELQQLAAELIQNLSTAFTAISHHEPVKAAYLIWKKPYMTVGGDTFIHHMMQKAGFENVFAQFKRYPTITINDLKSSGCSVVLLSSEPYPFKQKDLAELQQELPGVKLLIVDGEMFSWYGSRLLQSVEYFITLRQKATFNQ
jgi:ABC-type Fe3+-hydroxamate transport system substrate-binding protein